MTLPTHVYVPFRFALGQAQQIDLHTLSFSPFDTSKQSSVFRVHDDCRDLSGRDIVSNRNAIKPEGCQTPHVGLVR
jgi:hypothetical protein